MHVAVSGGTGFIGRPLVDTLLLQGHQVRLLTRDPRRVAARSGVQAAALFPAPDVGGCDAVVNLAGEPINQRWSAAARRRILDSRVQATSAIAEAARRSGTVKVMVSASATGFYGGARGDEALDEGDSPGNDFTARVCSAWEEAARPAEQAGLRLALLRIGVVLHTDGGALQKMLPPFKLGLAGPLGSGRQWMSWVHRDDVVSLVLHALRTEAASGPLNATAPEPVTNADFTKALGRALHRPTFLRAPAAALRLALGEMSTLLLDGQKVLPRRTLETGFRFAYPTLDAAFAQLFGRN
ncbi:MAG TPA: TIGR01777 family oxidoreductase [Myxococcaceae bacterium]|nr:TIGR01777 family oxidoreductase [Myxococcaceae bacterium]